LLTRVQAMFLDGLLVLEQTARSRSGRFFNFNGTAGLWRKSCIEEAGGWQHDTLTEDLDLSYRAQLAGWKFIFLPDVVTPAELPVDMNGFKSQQHRWTKGSIQTCKKLLPTIWRSKLPFPIKLEATGHLMSNFAYLLLACLCVLLHPSVGGPQVGAVASLQIPAAQIGLAHRGAGLRDLFQLLRLVRDRASTIHLGPVSAHVPEWLSLCRALLACALVAKNQLWRLTCRRHNSRVTRKSI